MQTELLMSCNAGNYLRLSNNAQEPPESHLVVLEGLRGMYIVMNRQSYGARDPIVVGYVQGIHLHPYTISLVPIHIIFKNSMF